jgi:hypothetical protein
MSKPAPSISPRPTQLHDAVQEGRLLAEAAFVEGW